jgi:membrane protease YdiL (CAAX protease family)
MLENEKSIHPAYAIIIILISVGLGFVLVGPLIGLVAAGPFYEGDFLELAETIQDPTEHPEVKIPIYILQGFATFIGLIVTPIVLLLAFRKSILTFFKDKDFYSSTLLITPLIVITFMGVNSIFVQFNADFHFPEFMKSFEDWAREKESYAAELTVFMTNFESKAELMIALIVIAVLPAIGEELVFRGLIQNELNKLTKNAHIAIWLSAILFSAFHLQFFGFLPRVLLGALFGYLYYWSGNLTMAILAHFTNNAVAIISLYYYRQGSLEYNVETTEAFPIHVVLFACLLTISLLYYFRNFYQNRSTFLHEQ